MTTEMFAKDSKEEKEVASLNQYWYSQPSIATLVSEVEMNATKCAFLSCPSLYFSLTSEELRANSKCFEFDRRWEQDPGFVFYDYNHSDKIPVSLWESFDYVVVDPPFITREVWTLYAEAVKLILKKGGKVLFTSVIENHTMLEEVMGDADTTFPLMVPRFRPSIPHLTYQYHCFTNYPSSKLEVENPELPPEDPEVIAARAMCNDMRESQKAFTSQMVNRDRTNEVAIPKLPAQEGGGNDTTMKWTRIPEGLTEYANGAAAPPEEAAPIDYGPLHASLVERRTLMEEYRKLVDVIFRHCDAYLKVGPGSKKKQTPEEQEAERASILQQKDEGLARMGAIKDILSKEAAEHTVCLLIDETIKVLTNAHTLTLQQYKELSADCTRQYKSPVFNRQKELLQEIKAAKKAATTTPAAA